MLARISSIGTSIGEFWCQVMHPDPMWPVQGRYRCPSCHRSYSVPWEQKAVDPAQHPAKEGRSKKAVTASAPQIA